MRTFLCNFVATTNCLIHYRCVTWLFCLYTADFGDYNAAEHASQQYLTEAVLLPPVPQQMLCKVVELHKLHKGQTPADAEYQFLDHAKRLELYGVDLHRAMVSDTE